MHKSVRMEPLEPRKLLSTTLRIDAGDNVPFTDSTGSTWVADQYFNGGFVEVGNYAVANTTSDKLYADRRFGNFNYSIPVHNGTSQVTLYFTDPTSARGQRIFDVFAESTQPINDFDIVAEVGTKASHSKSFNVNVSDGRLDLRFVSVVGNATVSAIQVIYPDTSTTPPASTGWTNLFNGQNLNGFYTWLPSEGKNRDSKGVFRVTNGMLHILGNTPTGANQDFGYLSTNSNYSNYRLRFDYKWGVDKFPPRATEKRDSGVMFHATGVDRIFPTSIEFQIQEGDTGDAWFLENARGTSTIQSGTPQSNVKNYMELGEVYTFPTAYSRLIKNANTERLTDWNTCEIIVSGDSAVYIVNGRVVNRAYGFTAGGAKLTSGRIMFQAEGAEIYYRNIQIQSLPYASAPSGATVLFNGSNTNAWRKRDANVNVSWPITNGALTVNPGTGDIITRENFTNFTLHLEFKTNVTPNVSDEQGKGNSGVYLQGRYEVQILDSYGRSLSGKNDLGSIYSVADPITNASLPAETWQTYDITFTAAKWSGSTKISNARVTVKLNGQVVQNNVQIPVSTLLGYSENSSAGPILLQDHGNRVQFRNIWLVKN